VVNSKYLGEDYRMLTRLRLIVAQLREWLISFVSVVLPPVLSFLRGGT